MHEARLVHTCYCRVWDFSKRRNAECACLKNRVISSLIASKSLVLS